MKAGSPAKTWPTPDNTLPFFTGKTQTTNSNKKPHSLIVVVIKERGVPAFKCFSTTTDPAIPNFGTLWNNLNHRGQLRSRESSFQHLFISVIVDAIPQNRILVQLHGGTEIICFIFTAGSQRAQRIYIIFLCLPLRGPILLVGMQARAVNPCPNNIKPINN